MKAINFPTAQGFILSLSSFLRISLSTFCSIFIMAGSQGPSLFTSIFTLRIPNMPAVTVLTSMSIKLNEVFTWYPQAGNCGAAGRATGSRPQKTYNCLACEYRADLALPTGPSATVLRFTKQLFNERAKNASRSKGRVFFISI